MCNNPICNCYEIFQVRRLQQQQLIYICTNVPAPFWCFQMYSFFAKLALLSCHARSAIGLHLCHILVFSYYIVLVRISFFLIPVMCEAGSNVVRLKVVARLCRIRGFFAAFHLTIMRYECLFAPARISLFSKFATVETGHNYRLFDIVK